MTLPWMEAVQQRLEQANVTERLGHAPLICGPAGLGKRALAEWLLARVLCLAPAGEAPCGKCRSCELLASGSHPDSFRLAIPEDKKEIPVDNVRGLIASLQLTPRIGPNRVGLIEPAEAMNRNAANALLKTLEEPAENAWLILVSHQPGRLPATIRSRCQKIVIRPPEPDAASAWLAERHPELDQADRARILTLAAGAPLAASALLADNGLEHGQQILDGLLKVASGGPVSAIAGEDWHAQPESSWHWLSTWMAAFMRQAQGMRGDALPEGFRLPRPVAPERLARLWEQALAGRRMASSAVRHDLLIGKWLLEWARSFTPER